MTSLLPAEDPHETQHVAVLPNCFGQPLVVLGVVFATVFFEHSPRPGVQMGFVWLTVDTQVFECLVALPFDLGGAPLRQFGNNLGGNFDIAQLHSGGENHLNLRIGLDVTAFHRGSEDHLFGREKGLEE